MVNLPASLEKIGEGAFRECSGLESLAIPEKVKALPKYLCAWDTTLREVKLPSRLEDIGSHAFAYCGKLDSISIPASVAHIGSNAFSFCSSLKSVELPRNMRELESYAFSECVSLESARMPANKKLLGELIFSGCTSLRDITVMSPVPPPFDCNSFIFEPDETSIYEKCRLHVPSGTEAAYSKAPGWNLFF